MQVSDLLVQYQNNLAAGSEISTGTKGVEQLVETMKQLKVGNIFEGTVNSIKGSQVILGLSSGQNITARLDKGIVLSRGQSVFFQVKSNDNGQVQIKPVSVDGFSGNPTLMQALDAANLPLSEKNLNMVHAMMREQMSIDARSLQEMSRALFPFKGASPATMVEMTRLQIPLTENNIAQFENYKEDQGAVMQQMKRLFLELGDMMGQMDQTIEDGAALNKALVDFFTGEESAPGLQENLNAAKADGLAEHSNGVMQQAGEMPLEGNGQMTAGRTAVFSQKLLPMEEYPQGSLGASLKPEEFADLQKQLSNFPEFLDSHGKYLDQNGQLLPESQAKELLRDLAAFLSKNSASFKKDAFSDLMTSKGYQRLGVKMLEEQWTLQPKELTEAHTVRDLYQRMEQQLQQLNEIVGKYPKAGTTVSQAAGNLSSNIEFMNQINQMYSYVQIPVRLSGQNVNSELFVYSNKKANTGEDGPLSAFLHFDMEAMGSMDISVKLFQKQVSTNWYLDSEETLELIANNIQLLTRRLEEKGYHCEMNFEQAARKVNFVDDLLKANQKSTGQLHRYSFDVRA